jgi:hypothetical protein
MNNSYTLWINKTSFEIFFNFLHCMYEIYHTVTADTKITCWDLVNRPEVQDGMAIYRHNLLE